MDQGKGQKRNDESRSLLWEAWKHEVVAKEYALVMHFETSTKLRCGGFSQHGK